MPAEFLPQSELVVHASVHQRLLQLFETHCALDVHGSPMLWGRPQKVVVEPTSGWHVVLAYVAQSLAVLQPGKQTLWLLASSRQTPAMPAEFLPQSELVVHASVHHDPLQLFETHCPLDVHGSPMLANVVGGVAPDEVPEGAPDGAPIWVPDCAPDVVPDCAPDGVPDCAPDGAPDGVPDCAPDGAAICIPDCAPDAVPDSVEPLL
jgi:hypothetical protein